MSKNKNTNDDKIIRAVDIKGEKIHSEMDMSYGQYLNLKDVLASQNPVSDEHDEMLFIIIHQTSELWIKLCLHEVKGAIAQIQKDDPGPAFKMLARISLIQAQLIQSWEVLTTLTPSDYLKFRDKLGRSSGFQSYQYRLLEYLVGNKNESLAKIHENNDKAYVKLKDALNTASLYDETLKLLSRSGFKIPKESLERDWSQPYEASEAVEDVWLEIYQNETKHWVFYELAEKLVDFEQHFQHWRFSHLKTVERIIGHKRGTGGSSGAPYLAQALRLSFFPELWSVRTRL